MKTSQSVFSAVIFAGLLSASSLANVIVSPAIPVKFDVPAPDKVVSPTGLPGSYEGKVVSVTMTIDATGQAHDIKVVRAEDKRLTKSLVSALSQWKFTPARKNGVAVSSRVLLPLKLVSS